MAAGPSVLDFAVLLPFPPDWQKERDVDFGTVRRTAGKNFGLAIPADLLEKLKQEFDGCTTPESRVGLYVRCFPWRKYCKDDDDSLKTAETSTKHLKCATEKYIKKEYLDALHECNRAVAYAPSDDEGLGRAYADRSEVLMALNEHEEAIVDIHRAFTSRCPPELRPVLVERESKCKAMIKEKPGTEQPKPTCSHDFGIEGMRQADRLKAKKYYTEVLFPTKSAKSKELRTFVSQKVELKDLDGQICFVMKDEVPAGTVLLTDKPYTVVVTDYLDGNCDYCLKKLLGGIPCTNCVNALYCDKICHDKAQEEFHGRFECSFMNYIIRVKGKALLRTMVLVVLRIICKLGPDCLYRLFQDGPEESSHPSTSRPTALSDYMKIYNILKPSQSIRPSNQLGNWIQARILVSILHRKTSFFESVDPEKKNNFKEFLTTFIIRHLASPQVAMPLQEVSNGNTMKGLRQRGLKDEKSGAMSKILECMDYGSGVYPVASYLLHSCDPNVIVQSAVKGGVVSVISSRLLKKGEILRINLAWHFLYARREDRQQLLKEVLFLECDCLACREEWPYYDLLKIEKPKFCYPRCTSHFSYIQKGMRGFDGCVVSEPHFRCPKCRKSYGGEKFAKQLQMFSKKMSLAKTHISGERPFAVITEALEAMKFHHQNQVCPPFFDALWHQEVFRGALAHMVSLHIIPDCKVKI